VLIGRGVDIYQTVSCVQGTLIRVFDVSSRRQLTELRRGADTAMLYWSSLSLSLSVCLSVCLCLSASMSTFVCLCVLPAATVSCTNDMNSVSPVDSLDDYEGTVALR